MVFSVKKNDTTKETTYNRLRSLGFIETEEGFYIEMNNFGNTNKRKTAREANRYRKAWQLQKETSSH